MKIDLTCPVELWQYSMPTENNAECTFVLNNLSSKVVVSVMVTLAGYDKENNLLFRQSERTQGLKAGVGERFTILFLPSQWENVESTDLTIEKVWFDDATVWRKGNAPLANYTPNNLKSSRALDELRFVAGRDAVGYPERQMQVWVCVCGRANSLDAVRCCRCERGRDYVFASLSRDNVKQIIAVHEKKLSDVAREAREENSRLMEADQLLRLRKKKKKRRVIALAIAGATLAAACVAAWIWGIPALRYHQATQQMNAGKYTEASDAFAAMGDYADAADMTTECSYRAASDMLADGGDDSLLAAMSAFGEISEYKDSADLAKKAQYQLGESYLSQGLYEKAMEQFQALGEYEDSAARADQCVYEQAGVLMESGNVKTALVLYQMVPDYLDAAEKAKECYYRLGLTATDEGKDDEAARFFASAGDYSDAASQQQGLVYRQAEEALEKGQLLQAGELFLSISDYSDALAKGQDCMYQHGKERLEVEDYVSAAAAFEKIPDYLDSASLTSQCYYQQGLEMMAEGQYAAAAPCFEKAGDSQDAASQLQECYFHMGQAALDGKDYANAESCFEKAGDYEGSAEKLQETRYQSGIHMMQTGDYAGAADVFTLLGDYGESSQMHTQCVYQLGAAAFESGDFAAAQGFFGQILDYEDSREFYTKAALEVANTMETDLNVEDALAQLPNLDPDSDAAQKLTELLLNEGVRLESTGDYAAAADLYGKMSGNEEARKRLKNCQYQMALGLQMDGKTREAGDAFYALGDYEDAASLAQECYTELYGTLADNARAAMENKDYAGVVALLKDADLSALPEAYADLQTLYPTALVEFADQLYQAGRPYEAIPFYQAASAYEDMDKKLGRRAYLILGSWKAASGEGEAQFRLDGTCTIAGEEMHFRVSNFSLLTGASADDLSRNFQIIRLTEDDITLRDLRGERTHDYKFVKSAGVEFPAQLPDPLPSLEGAPQAAEEPAQEEDFQVTED